MNELKVIANELVPVYENENKERIINARELYSFLELGRDFPTWITDRLARYGFLLGIDFSTIRGKSTGGRPTTEYYLKIDVAKEIAMVENNEQGRKVRQYFIAVEKKAREMFQVPKTLPEALRLAAELAEKIEQDKPKVFFAEKCLKSKDSILIRELAKIACDQGFEIGEHRLYKKLRDWGLLDSKNMPYQRYEKYFRVLQRSFTTYSGEALKFTTKVTPQGQLYILNRLAREN